MHAMQQAWQWFGKWDLSLCLSFNRLGRFWPLTGLLRVCSRLGDGVFWYSLIAVLPLHYGWQGLQASLHMLLIAGLGLLIYKWLKTRTVRPRPCAVSQHVTQHTAALDQFSFPSGHTLHAVCFSTVLLAYFPGLALLVVPFTFLVAVSRPVLGVHYPSDVLAGAALGYLLAEGSLLLLS